MSSTAHRPTKIGCRYARLARLARLAALLAVPALAACSAAPPATATDTEAATSEDTTASQTTGATTTSPTTSSPTEPGSTSTAEPTTSSSSDASTSTGEPCPTGSLACPCLPGQVCDGGLACVDEVCEPVPPGACGDGLVDRGESCDAGRDNGPGKACKADCSFNICGDGDLGPGELCDDGNTEDSDACSNTCTVASCGDGLIQRGEQCDDGNPVETDACTSTCSAASCGDGFVQPSNDEACDAGPDNGPGKACKTGCALNVCGDGDQGPGELCDDGNAEDSDACSNSCTVASCGDGLTQRGEECDDGNQVETDACTSSCSAASCGDGFVQPSNDETCDAGPNNGPGKACKLDCTLNVCGDGDQGPGELCDDGNAEDLDACSNGCTIASCGDGITQQGEQCDDGNQVETDACTSSCSAASCGDGFVQPSNDETCDAGPGNGPGKACKLDCSLNVCGDGDQGPGELCDDGNTDDLDACSNSCAVASCGDGITQQGEECDDGNMANNDGCSASCVSQGVLAISAGETHTCVLLAGGSVRCWGQATFGKLGYGNNQTIGDNEHPYTAGDVNVGGTVVSVGAGVYHTCALLAGGTVRCWGAGGSGRLGYGNTVNIGDNEAPAVAGNVPVGGQVAQLSVGGDHTCALMVGGAVRCWGMAESGRLGYGNANDIGDNETPAWAGDVPVGAPVVKVVAGIAHTCALLQNGAVRCWGVSSGLGYPGQGPVGDNETPASVGDVNVGGPVADIAVGAQFTCVVMAGGGEVKCWGSGNVGQLGYGNLNTIGDNEHPAAVGFVAVGGPAIKVTAGQHHTCAVLQSGAVRCWGEAANGRLGYGNLTDIGDNEVPLAVGTLSLGGDVVDIDADWSHTCAILENSAVRCWGYGNFAQLGYANTFDVGDNELPSSVGPVQVY